MRPLWLWWSSGKDAAWALEELLDDDAWHVTALVTTIDASTERIPFQNTGRALLELQASATGLPLHVVELPPSCPNDAYERAFAALAARARDEGVDAMAFGDLALDDVRVWREGLLRRHGMDAHFPLWGRDTTQLARTMIDGGLEAVITTVDPRRLDRAWLGRDFDHAFLDALPDDVDPCGENGEFHTFVHAGPMLIDRLEVAVGQPFEQGDFVGAEPVQSLHVDGELDLHTIPPKQVGDLVDDYLDTCRAQGVLQVRIVHGKGIGALRETVHARLRRRDDVLEFGLGGAGAGSWGATLVRLQPLEDDR